MKAPLIVALAASTALLSACGVLGGSSPQPGPRTSAVARPSTATPERVVRSFADAYINWTAGTVGRDMSRLATASVGQARSALQLAAAQTAGDYELKRGGIANSGTVEAITPLPASRHQYIVVTREQTSATADAAYQGLRPAWHVAIATVATVPGGWVLSGWQPES